MTILVACQASVGQKQLGPSLLKCIFVEGGTKVESLAGNGTQDLRQDFVIHIKDYTMDYNGII